MARQGSSSKGDRLKEVEAKQQKKGSHLVLGGEGTLGTLGLAAQLLEGAVVLADVHLVLLLDQLDEVVHHAVVKVLSSQMCVTAG